MKRKLRCLSILRETLRDLSGNRLRQVAGGVSDIGTNCAGLCITCNPNNCLQNPPVLPPGTGPVTTYPTVHNQTCEGVSAAVTDCATECPSELPGC